tara:strand:- start:116 stop:355 length:240 start_codon:yes stop_codon:yes gene_type:complete
LFNRKNSKESVIIKNGSRPQKILEPIKAIIGTDIQNQTIIIKIINPTFGKDLFGHILIDNFGSSFAEKEYVSLFDLIVE